MGVRRIAQVVTKDGIVMAITTVDYPSTVVKDMKKAGYKVMEISDNEVSQWETEGYKKPRRKRTAR